MWHNSLTEENRKDLERVQKSALKVILKKDYLNYEDALKLTNLQGLNERRQMIAMRFAKNCLKNENYSKQSKTWDEGERPSKVSNKKGKYRKVQRLINYLHEKIIE